MTEPAPTTSSVPSAPPELPAKPGRGPRKDFRFALRRSLPAWQAVLMGIIGVAACLAVWWFVTSRRTGRADHPAVEGAVEPRGNLRELLQPLV